jgi:hypothetical protein
MAMKLAITHTKKVPGQEDYSSEGFGATIEVEVPEEQAHNTTSVQGWLRELYDQAKQAVEEQLRSVPRRNNGGQTAAGIFGRPNNGPQGNDRPASGDGNATPKQISFLVSLGARNKLTFADLQRIAQERFQAEDLYRLSKQQASEMIDSLKPKPSRR